MPKTVITLPCTAQELESALHAVCDHHGLWNGRIDTLCDGSDSGDACVSIVLSEGSGGSSPSPSSPTSFAPTESAVKRSERAEIEADALAVGFGDAAAIREALYDIVMLTMKVGLSIHGDVACGIIASKAKRALAKPARNCDRFGGDYKMLHTAWFVWTASPSGMNPDGTAKMAFGEWLLAPAIKERRD